MKSENGTDALDRLAERMGIESDYRDARGHLVRIGAEPRRNLLAAMRQNATTEAQAAASLAALDRAAWIDPLPPVQVVCADDDNPAVDLVLPEGTTETIRWRLNLEGGGQREGHIAFGQLECSAAIKLDARKLERRRLPLPGDLPWGYHSLTVEPGGGATTIIVTPGRCWLPETLREGRRLWGIAAQLYLLRSDNNWGIGDFTDLRQLVDMAASRGAGVIGLNPLHALFFDDPDHVSPYSPASRLMLNVLNIDVTAIPELAACAEMLSLIASDAFRSRLEAARAARLVDYAAVAKLKLPVLEKLFDACRTAADRRWREFEKFRRERGEVFARHCLFIALREHFANKDPALADWHAWPADFHRPGSSAVARFRAENQSRLDFLTWLQWIADEQLAAAASAASEQGMAVGLYRDLAIGADRSGAESWADSDAIVSDAQVGAPPDIYNPQGQDWGLPPLHPIALRQQGYRNFIELIRANMRHAGGLRIDHVMGLRHLWFVPAGKHPADGAYVRYPLEDLIGILALESHRHRCLVVGEDLGTVPEGFRERLEAAKILSYRVLFFEQDSATGTFLPPETYPQAALAVAGSHDLPTLRGWWDRTDLDLKSRLDLYPRPEDETSLRDARERDQSQLLLALRQEGLLHPEEKPSTVALTRAVHAYLARGKAMLAMAQIDDLTGEADPVNVPTTTSEHPNWRRRLGMTLEQLVQHPDFDDIARIFNAERDGRPERLTVHG